MSSIEQRQGRGQRAQGKGKGQVALCPLPSALCLESLEGFEHGIVAGFIASVVQNFAVVLAPTYASGLLLYLMAPAGIAMMVWLLVKGLDAEKWQVAAASSGMLQT